MTKAHHERIQVYRLGNGMWHWECSCTHCPAVTYMQLGTFPTWSMAVIQADYHGRFYHAQPICRDYRQAA